MKQIKTIQETSATLFDEAVNAALADGWELVRRDVYGDHALSIVFVSFLEREEEAEDEAPVVSQWLPTRDPYHPYRCAACGLKANHPYDECPGCGAIMEGEA